MISTTARRTFFNPSAIDGLIARQPRFASSLTPPQLQNKKTSGPTTRRELHATSVAKADASTTVDEPAVASPVAAKTSSIVDRFTTTFEVTVSKLFPAGFGWQTASIIAENNFGYAPDTAAFALTTGIGDGIAVMLGHVAFYGTKKVVLGSNAIDMNKEAQTGLLLGSAAVWSGTLWQPLVDALQGANLSFMQVFAGTWIGCGTAFYMGLRVGRTILGGYFEHIEEPTFENNMNDNSLSAAIGGASAFFVGTDAAYLPDQNFLIDVVGIKDGIPDLTGCAIAGTSTALGFVGAQSALNVVYPAGKLWND